MSPELKARLVDIHKTLVRELADLNETIPGNSLREYTFNELELYVQEANSRVSRMEVVLGFLKDTVDGDWK